MKNPKNKRSRARCLPTYGALEPRQLLATVVADFSADFPVPGQPQDNGWSYSWNAPISGSVNSNPIDSSDLQLIPLKPVGNSGSFTPDGDTNPLTDPASAFVRLSRIGGHPGVPGEVTGGVDRFVVASYTITESGFYRLGDSTVGLYPTSNRMANDGVDVRVFVNRGNAVEREHVDAFSKNYFDTELGFLTAGDTVNVAFGAGASNFADFFTTNFQILRDDARTDIVGNYRTDFLTAESVDSNWSYYWNAPQLWTGNGPAGFQRTGAIGNPENYLPLQFSDGVWTADGDTNGFNSAPDYFLKLGADGGQPGNAFVSNVLQDRYAIAAFTFEQSGHYAIADSFLNVDLTSADGLEIYIHVDDGARVSSEPILAAPGNTTSFDIDLGYVEKGSTVYVAFGANGNHIRDRFTTDFSIARHLPRAKPDLSQLDNVVTSIRVNDSFYGLPGATADDSQDDTAAIARAIQYAIATGIDEIEFAPGTYDVAGNADSTDSIFRIASTNDLILEGNGSTLLISDYNSGLFAVHNSSEIVFKDFTVDYAERVVSPNPAVPDLYRPLTFTQGIITEVDLANESFTLQVNLDAFIAPDNSFTHFESRGWGYLVDPIIDGRLKEGSRWHYTTRSVERIGNSDEFRIGTIGSLMSGLEVGDRYVMQRRFNQSLIGAFNNSSNVSVTGVTAYTAPSVFVGANNSQSINVIDSHVAVRPNDRPQSPEAKRWKSINADAIHIQSNRIGPWVENSTFDGIGDDVMNIYTQPMTVLEQHSTNEFTLGMIVLDSLGNINDSLIQVGDQLSFFDPVAGEMLKDVRVTSVTGRSILSPDGSGNNVRVQTIRVDQSITGITVGDLSDSAGYRNETTVFNNSVAQGSMIQGNEIRNARRYGTYLLSSNVQILDNAYEGLSDQAIAAHNEPGWPLGTFANDILIQGNRFVDNGFSLQFNDYDVHTGVIGFTGIRYESPTSPENLIEQSDPLFEDIRILDNVFYDWSKSAVSIRNSEQVFVSGNSVVTPAVNDENAIPFKVEWSSDVELTSNSTVGGDSAIEVSNSTHVTQTRTRIVGDYGLENWIRFDRGSVRTDSGAGDLVPMFEDAGTTQGRFDNGVVFNRTNSVSFETDRETLDTRSISLWFTINDVATDEPQLIYSEGDRNQGLNIYVMSGNLYVGGFNVGAYATYLDTDKIESGKWHHVALVLDNNFGKLRGYLDGQKFEVGDARRIPSRPGFISLGAPGVGGTRFHTSVGLGTRTGMAGQVDDLRIYNRVVSDSEIAALAEQW